MKCLLTFCLGVIVGVLFVINFHLCDPGSWKRQVQKLESTQKELYETKMEVRKLWKEKNLAWAEVARVKARLSEEN